MRITAVVCAHWFERFNNVDCIVADLLEGTTRPNTIIILNNNPYFPDRFKRWEERGVKVTGGWNTECRGKYVAGLLAYADYYLLMDDDFSVGKRTLEFLVERAYPGLVTANRGAIMRTDSFYAAELVDADKIQIPQRVTSIHGSGVFMAHSALLRMFALESQIRDRWPTEGDDILAGLANKGHVEIFPMKGEAAWVPLDTCGVAMNKAKGYYEMRDEFTRDVLAVLG